jgi:cobyrinic acid a,c-diamide synthase
VENERFAFLIGGTHSGCGKTTIALALMAAFKARGMRVQPFKVGPDFIDPGFHTQITGVESRNLDGWMLERGYNQELFGRLLGWADMAIVEGVMGLFDGYDGLTESGSSAEMAKWLGLPAILVVDARSMARSAAALVYGFRHFDTELRFAGVIFNRIGGEGHLGYLKEAMAASLPDVAVLGGIPQEDPIRIPERHLGLVTADEIFIDEEWERNLAGLVERYVDLDSILRVAGWLERCEEGSEKGRGEEQKDWIPAFAGMTREGSATVTGKVEGAGAKWARGGRRDLEGYLSQGGVGRVPIAVARDAAFCFYYPDNFDLLREAGAELHFFAPLVGESLPEDAAGVYLGGGYPEVYAEKLASHKEFLETIRAAVARGMPVYAECGGLMVLSRFIDTLEGKRFPMAGVLPFGTRMLPRRKALGYTEVLLRERCLLGGPDLVLRGHEFHYSEIVEEEANPAMTLAYRIRGRKFMNERPEGYQVGSALASYVHLHWGSAPAAAEAFVERCREYQRKTRE